MSNAKEFFKRPVCEAVGFIDEGGALEPFATDEPASIEGHEGKQLRVVILSKGDFQRLVKRARIGVTYSDRSIDRNTVAKTERRVEAIRKQLRSNP